ncbi:hypothetical protein CTEN210_08322 [Chaetoceros tenuissimus]|uniref:Leucine-rich repeat domain-containing protein n=1 Tax=Chaetoceros tenuissimus TaxID=426638 RepID=A0AAD3CVD1_9STRA|nr:hypothetical protein CTEN210_08322 [Chaetoceros tenuissimus]
MKSKLGKSLTDTEWVEIVALGPGIRMYKGKKTHFYNGEKIWEGMLTFIRHNLVYNWEERQTWEVIIVLPGVEIIPWNTFNGCSNLETVIMPDTVKRIEVGAFCQCKCLVYIRLSRNLEYIGNWAFDSCALLETVIMPDTVKRIEVGAFCQCKCLVYIRLSRNLEYIGESAFESCESLTSIFIPPSCRKIDDKAFLRCTHLLMVVKKKQDRNLGRRIYQGTAFIKKLTSECVKHGFYNQQSKEAAVQWIRSIQQGEAKALHSACASCNPVFETIYALVKQRGIKAMRMENLFGFTPSHFLSANPYSEIEEGDLVKKYILEMMGEVV